MSRLPTIADGEWITPNMRSWKLQCCKCSLVHTLQFRVIRNGRRNTVQFRAWRHPRTKSK